MDEMPLPLPRPTDPAPPDRLIELYAAGECTLAEQAAMARWIAANPGVGTALRAMRADGDEASHWVETDPQFVRGTGAILRQTPTVAPRAPQLQRQPRWSAFRHTKPDGSSSPVAPRPVWRWIAPLVVAGFMGIGLYHNWTAIARSVGGVVGGSSATVQQLTTAPGQRASIKLVDGTNITLGVSSRLDIPADFGVRNRTITLDGEALFEVTHASGTPFVVRTATSSTRVLGTTFAVRQYGSEPMSVVHVLDGKVVLGSSVLTAGQQGVQRSDGTVVIAPVGRTKGIEWMTGRLSFDHVPLRDVVTELNRWYDVEFVIDDPSLVNEIVTLTLVNRSSEEASTVLRDILKIHYRRTATQILLTR